MSPIKGEPLREPSDQPKKKKRIIGSFPCPDCSKVFTRADHLSRHFLNHKPKEVFICKYTVKDLLNRTRECGKTFVRKDLRERHYKRHLAEKSDSLSKQLADGSSQSPADTIANESKELHSNETQQRSQFIKPKMSNISSPSHISTSHGQFQSSLQIGSMVDNPTNQQSKGLLPVDEAQLLVSQNQGSISHQQDPSAYFNQNKPLPLTPTNQYPASSGMLTNLYSRQDYGLNNNKKDLFRTATTVPYSEGDIISWLFTDNDDGTNSTKNSGGMPIMPATGLEYSPNTSSYYAPSPAIDAPLIDKRNFPTYNVQGLSHNDTNQHNLIARGSQKNFIPNANDPQNTTRTIMPRHQEPSESSWTPFYYPAPKDQLYSNGLQDLNYFFNNDNPLEEILNTSPNENALGLLGILPSTVSSSSPSQSNESFTPKSINEVLGHDNNHDLFESHAKAFATIINSPKNRQVYVNSFTLGRMIELIPSLNEKEIRALFPSTESSSLEDRFSFFLQCYWDTFQPKFSILHRPSFSTETTEPLLLLAMVCVGSMYSAYSALHSLREKMSPEFKFCMQIIKPLRFVLFQHSEFKSPVKVWILQTLNLLEWCEKNHLLREMHERAHIHHGTTVQLLRRSPFLGGNPAVTNKAATSASDTGTSGGEDENSDGISDVEDQVNSDRALFRKWVDSESMKRITFMTFYLDVIDYIKFRHNPQIPFFQLQLLNLPCDEEQLWNNEEVNGSFQKVVKRQKKLHRSSNILGRGVKDTNRIRPGMNFLNAMKRVLKAQREKVSFSRTSIFIKNILIGGISSLMHQMQLSEFQNNFTAMLAPSDKKRNSIWKEILMKALDNCESELFSASNVPSADSIFPTQLVRCKFPMFHLLQIIGLSDINHYDIAIFGGSPRNMSVDATSKDQQLIQRKLHTIWNLGKWMESISDVSNARSVIHCYWLLWRILLAPMDESGEPTDPNWAQAWQADFDFFDSMYAVSIATLVLWCYTFATCGPESQKFNEGADTWPLSDLRSYTKVIELCEENGFQYLARIRHQFVRLTNPPGSDGMYVLHLKSPLRSFPLNEEMKAYCQKLPFIEKKENIGGLCFLVGSTLLNSQWEVIRENAKLIINCGLRSIGKQAVHCPDLFDNVFLS